MAFRPVGIERETLAVRWIKARKRTRLKGLRRVGPHRADIKLTRDGVLGVGGAVTRADEINVCGDKASAGKVNRGRYRRGRRFI